MFIISTKKFYLFLSISIYLVIFTNCNPQEFSKVLKEGDTCYAKLYPEKKSDHHSPSIYYSRCYNHCKKEARKEKETKDNKEVNNVGNNEENKKKANSFVYDYDKLHQCNMGCMTNTRDNIKIFCMQVQESNEINDKENNEKDSESNHSEL